MLSLCGLPDIALDKHAQVTAAVEVQIIGDLACQVDQVGLVERIEDVLVHTGSLVLNVASGNGIYAVMSDLSEVFREY